MPCCAVLCRALQSVLFRSYQTTTPARIQCWPDPACMSSIILCSCCLYFQLLSFIFRFSFDCNKHLRAVRMQQYIVVPQYVPICMSLKREHSKAQHNPPAKGSKPSTCRSEYVQKECVLSLHAASCLFSWSMELLALASRLCTPKILDHLLYICL